MPIYKRALVTGGAGFIGGHLAHALVAEGLTVTCLDNLVMGKRENVPPQARLVEGDVRDRDLTKKLAAEADIVFHEAAVVAIRTSMEGFYNDADTNIMGALSMLDACKGSPVRKFLFASSMAVYGESTAAMTEDYEIAPISPYGISKLAGEKYVLNICRTLGIDSVVLRYFNAYGTKQTFTPYVGVITIFIKKLLAGEPITIFGAGEQTRDYVSVRDLIQANLLAMNKDVNGEIFNVASGVTRSVNEIAEMLIDELAPGVVPGYEPSQPGEIFRSEPDITKARTVLGYEPAGDLKRDIKEIIDWHRSLRP
ncbi:MAG: NAD-dependent epimerase/dehydratase family protein [Armatimonadota bacterium]|nr:NAD-dependent epimerase/dehydratase family protein [Armatimonadota bacterium]